MSNPEPAPPCWRRCCFPAAIGRLREPGLRADHAGRATGLQVTTLDDDSAKRAQAALAMFKKADRRDDVPTCERCRQKLRELRHLDH